jgi:hypothetical protein
MNARIILCGTCSSVLFVSALNLIAENDPARSPAPAGISPALAEKLRVAAANLSPMVIEIVRMSDAGADAAVIQAYIENSPSAHTLRSEEIIYLHDHGISTPIITAMIQHGARQREQAEVASAAVAPPTASGGTVVQTSPDYAASPTYVYPSYTSYPTYVYEYPSYPYISYPAFGAYFSWPYSYGRSYRHSYYGHSFGGGLRFSHSGTFRLGGSSIRHR